MSQGILHIENPPQGTYAQAAGILVAVLMSQSGATPSSSATVSILLFSDSFLLRCASSLMLPVRPGVRVLALLYGLFQGSLVPTLKTVLSFRVTSPCAFELASFIAAGMSPLVA